MNRALSTEELQRLQTDFPVTEERKPLTRQERLLRWADLVEKAPRLLGLYHRLEYQSQAQLDRLQVDDHNSALALAVKDDVFQKDGLTDKTVGGAQRYFELSTSDLHEFSCDCGGHISNTNQAGRIRGIAVRGTQSPGILGRIASAIAGA